MTAFFVIILVESGGIIAGLNKLTLKQTQKLKSVNDKTNSGVASHEHFLDIG
ncbi:hypothetical protein [Marinomonas fungiae]|uniref:hypothetical protein n=1 Tax=Marinomonas fungiae TaxID=1137284 RepID=UPI003A92157C